MRINIHSHVVPEGTLGAAGEWGPEAYVDERGYLFVRVGETRTRVTTVAIEETSDSDAQRKEAVERWRKSLSDPHVRVAEMDEKRIDVMGVTISPLFYLYEAPAEINIPFARIQNDSLAEYCANYPDRFFFMATVPIQDLDAAVAESERALGALGGRGINLAGADLGGYQLYDKALDPLWESACNHNAPIFIHPSPPKRQDGRYDKWAAMLGYPYQGTVAFASFAVGGVFDRFPDLKVYITHGGGFAPYQLGRIEKFGSLYHMAKRPASEYLDNFYFDLLLHDRAARQLLLDTVGIERVVVGDNFMGVDSADGFAFVEEMGLSPEDEQQIMSGNAARLFGLPIKEATR